MEVADIIFGGETVFVTDCDVDAPWCGIRFTTKKEGVKLGDEFVFDGYRFAVSDVVTCWRISAKPIPLAPPDELDAPRSEPQARAD